METIQEYLDRVRKEGQFPLIDVSLIPKGISPEQFMEVANLLFACIKIPKCN